MRVLLTGSNGQVGHAVNSISPERAEVFCVGHQQLDISDKDSVFQCIKETNPDIVINAAAYTDVELAESDSDAAYAVNARGASNLACAVNSVNAKLVHISTDYVFSNTEAISHEPSDATCPINVYGKTKLEGEALILKQLDSNGLILRTSWLYHHDGNNFVKTMLKLMKQRSEVRVVCDQIGAPTSADSLAKVIWKSIDKQLSGIYHWRDAGVASWYDFAVAINQIAYELNLIQHKVDVVPIRSDEFPTKAKRPMFSLLSIANTEHALDIRSEHWRVNLENMLKKLSNA